MNSLFNSSKCNDAIKRINQLTPELKAAWGKMTVNEMLCHCTDGMKMATGELAIKNKSNFLSRNILKPLIVYVFPMPKSAPTADEINPTVNGTKPVDFENDRAALIANIEKLTVLPESYSWAEHPFFGRMNHKQWGLLGYKHLDHHLKQFGV